MDSSLLGHSVSSGPILEIVPTRPSPILLKFYMNINKHTGGASVKFQHPMYNIGSTVALNVQVGIVVTIFTTNKCPFPTDYCHRSRAVRTVQTSKYTTFGAESENHKCGTLRPLVFSQKDPKLGEKFCHVK